MVVTQPTHKLADGQRVFPNGIDPADLIELTEEELQADAAIAALAEMRSKRNALLSASDFTQLPDTPLPIDRRTAWASYRQALRDLPQTTDPFAFDWPAPPGS